MVGEIYTEIILDLYKNPLNRGVIEKPEIDAQGGNPSCGDQARFTLRIKNGVIEDARFTGSGCAISIASESLLSEMVKGRRVEEAAKITGKELFEQLGNIVQTRIRCALLGLVVLKKGIEEYEKGGGKKIVLRGVIV